MSQLVACCFPGGVLLAADRRVAVERRGRDEIHSLRKLFPLGTCAAVATSGAAVGIAVSRSLHRFLQGRASPHLEDLEAYAVSVFQKEYAAFIRQGERWFRIHPHAHRLSYVLLAGQEGAGHHAFRFYASEAHHEPYRLLPTGPLLTAPRRLGLEGRLARAVAGGATGEALVELALEGLGIIGEKEPAVAPPFDWVLIRGAGITQGTDTTAP